MINLADRLICAWIVISISLLPTHGLAQPQSLQDGTLFAALAGTWTLQSLYDETAEGLDVDPFGDEPKGILVFDSDRHYVLAFLGQGLKFASGERLKGTMFELQAAVHDTLAHFGRYEVSSVNNELMLHVERSSFPNWNGLTRTATIKLAGNTLELTSAAGSSLTGSWFSHSVWTRSSPRTVAMQ